MTQTMQPETTATKSMEVLADILRSKGFGIAQVLEGEETEKILGHRAIVLKSESIRVGFKAAEIALENGYPLCEVTQRWRVTHASQELEYGSSLALIFTC